MIYFIWSDLARKVKIGAHPDPKRYMDRLQPAHANSLVLLPEKGGSVQRVKEIHKMFSKERRIGDWFSLSKRMQLFIYNGEPPYFADEDAGAVLSIRDAALQLGMSHSTVHRIKLRLGLGKITIGDLPKMEKQAYENNMRQRASTTKGA